MKKIIHFIKYNNATVIIIALFFILGASVLASEQGRAVIGEKKTSIEGIDNTLLIEADLAKIDMDFRIEKIESDEKYYYITYTYIDLILLNNSWQYQLQEKTRKISLNLKEDLGEYLAEELNEQYELRLKELQIEQTKAQASGEEKRIKVVEYSGLIGKALNVADKVFPGYTAVKKQELAPLSLIALRTPGEKQKNTNSTPTTNQNVTDDITEIYEYYIEQNDPDQDNFFGVDDNCPQIYNPDQLDQDKDGIGDECDLTPLGDEATSTEEQIVNSSEDFSLDSDTDVKIIDLDNIVDNDNIDTSNTDEEPETIAKESIEEETFDVNLEPAVEPVSEPEPEVVPEPTPEPTLEPGPPAAEIVE